MSPWSYGNRKVHEETTVRSKVEHQSGPHLKLELEKSSISSHNSTIIRPADSLAWSRKTLFLCHIHMQPLQLTQHRNEGRDLYLSSSSTQNYCMHTLHASTFPPSRKKTGMKPCSACRITAWFHPHISMQNCHVTNYDVLQMKQLPAWI